MTAGIPRRAQRPSRQSTFPWRTERANGKYRRAMRMLRASARDTLVLLREFRRPLLLFGLTIAGSGTLYYLLSLRAGQPLGSLAEAWYEALSLIFLQSIVAFPSAWYLQVFFFAMPVIGLGILAQGLTDFGVLLFNRRARGKEWETAVASTMSNHVVLIGLGHLGYRVVRRLVELNQDVVVVEIAAEPDLLRSIRGMGVPVIQDDGTREVTLSSAGVQKARAIILCTQNDSLNLRMALKARSLNPNIEVVMRIFDDEFAASLEEQFGFRAMSATGMAAPLFASIAARIDMTPPISIEGQPHVLANLAVGPHSTLAGRTVLQVEEQFHVSVVMLCENGARQYHPPGGQTIHAGQTLTLFGEPEHINDLLRENHR